MHRAPEVLDRRGVDFEYEGEMTVDVALNPAAAAHYPFSRLTGPANILVVPARHSASISVKLMQEMAGATVIGPILTGVPQPIQICSTGATVNDILNMAVMAACRIGWGDDRLQPRLDQHRPCLPRAAPAAGRRDAGRRGYMRGLGGKGANQSVAALRAGARVVHIGAIGAADGWTAAQLSALGLDLGSSPGSMRRRAMRSSPSIRGARTDPHPSRRQPLQDLPIAAALKGAQAGDCLLLQNETSHQVEAAKLARARSGLRVFYSAAPFELEALLAVLPHVTHLLMNAGRGRGAVAARWARRWPICRSRR
jgi:hypothetical protein